jgi:hypothetical protein
MEYISINAHTIRKNAVTGSDEPPIRIARSRSDQKPRYAREIKINGPSRLIYNNEKAILRCGARMVLETETGSVEIVR